MGALLEQVLKLLTTETGSLTYHLVLAFSIAGAFQLVFNASSRLSPARLRRTLLGLGLLLTLQLCLFVVSGLAWQGILNGDLLLPALDRAVTLLSLVIIIWLWCFPDPSPAADVGTAILAAAVIAGSIFAMLWWLAQASFGPFNGSWMEQAALLLGLALSLLAIIYLLVARPDGWGYGLIMLATLAAGSFLQLIMTPDGGDYPSAVRLAQMVAYPFLLLLAQRIPLTNPETPLGPLDTELFTDVAGSSAASMYSNPQLWQALLRLSAETELDKISKGLTALVATALDADLCLLLSPPDADGKMQVSCAYDATGRRYLDPVVLDSRDLPMLATALRMGRSRRFSASSATPDLATLARVYQLDQSGNLLFTPILTPDGHTSYSLMILSPVSQRDWNVDEQAFMSTLSRLLVHFLQRSQEMNALKDELTRVRGMSRQVQDLAQQAVEERQKLRDQAAVLQENAARDHSQLTSLASMAAAYEAAQALISQLQEETAGLRQASQLSSDVSAQNIQILEGELRLALEEIAYLRNSLGEADARITLLKNSQVAGTPSGTQLQAIRSVAADLHAPLGSIAEQVDLLLSESQGILVPKQRRLLERIKVTTGRLDRLVDDLVAAAASESNTASLAFNPVDVGDLVRRAVRAEDRALREKQIVLRLDLPAKPVQIHSDAEALRSVLEGLLQNARTVSPQGSSVAIRARVESSDGEEDYVLLQVADSGGGISPQDLLRVFSSRPDDRSIPGLNDPTCQLPRIKSLIESLGGRTWVDTELGRGATFSVLLPVASGPNGNGTQP